MGFEVDEVAREQFAIIVEYFINLFAFRWYIISSVIHPELCCIYLFT